MPDSIAKPSTRVEAPAPIHKKAASGSSAGWEEF